jgi:hypothetical protein
MSDAPIIQPALESGHTESSEKPFLCRKPVRIIIYTGLALFLGAMIAFRFLPGLLDPTFEKHIANRQVAAGMTREQVLKAWGSPYTLNVSYTKEGIRREEWIFEDWISSAKIQHRYLYFEEGVLVGGWYHGTSDRPSLNDPPQQNPAKKPGP